MLGITMCFSMCLSAFVVCRQAANRQAGHCPKQPCLQKSCLLHSTFANMDPRLWEIAVEDFAHECLKLPFSFLICSLQQGLLTGKEVDTQCIPALKVLAFHTCRCKADNMAVVCRALSQLNSWFAFRCAFSFLDVVCRKAANRQGGDHSRHPSLQSSCLLQALVPTREHGCGCNWGFC